MPHFQRGIRRRVGGGAAIDQQGVGADGVEIGIFIGSDHIDFKIAAGGLPADSRPEVATGERHTTGSRDHVDAAAAVGKRRRHRRRNQPGRVVIGDGKVGQAAFEGIKKSDTQPRRFVRADHRRSELFTDAQAAGGAQSGLGKRSGIGRALGGADTAQGYGIGDRADPGGGDHHLDPAHFVSRKIYPGYRHRRPAGRSDHNAARAVGLPPGVRRDEHAIGNAARLSIYSKVIGYRQITDRLGAIGDTDCQQGRLAGHDRSRDNRLGYERHRRLEIKQCGCYRVAIGQATIGGNLPGRDAVHPVGAAIAAHHDIEQQGAVGSGRQGRAGHTDSTAAGGGADCGGTGAGGVGVTGICHLQAGGQRVGDADAGNRPLVVQVGKGDTHGGAATGPHFRGRETLGQPQDIRIGQGGVIRGVDGPDSAVRQGLFSGGIGRIRVNAGRADHIDLDLAGPGGGSAERRNGAAVERE